MISFTRFHLQEGKKCLHSLAKQIKLASSVLERHDAGSSLYVTGVDDDFAPYLGLKGVKDVPIHSCSIPDLLQPHEKHKVCIVCGGRTVSAECMHS